MLPLTHVVLSIEVGKEAVGPAKPVIHLWSWL
jgi:hypothetical protein